MTQNALIFIVSQPRSGSTYLQNLLSNNEQVNTCSEPWVLLNYAAQIKPKLVQGTYDHKFAVAALEAYGDSFEKKFLSDRLRDHLLSIYAPMAKGYSFVIDKTPRYWEILPEIADLFPEAKIIVLKRDPAAVVRSMLTTYHMKSVGELLRFSRDLLFGPKKIQAFLKQNETNNQVYSLRYEDLIDQTASCVKELYDWAGITYSDAVLNTANNTKFKGYFGDPYQNKPKATKGELPSWATKFLNGYEDFLGADFLEEYGNYQLSSTAQKTNHFNAYKFFSAGQHEPASAGFKSWLKRRYFGLLGIK